jgi:hypothetical protein
MVNPPIIDACDLNFTDGALGSVPSRDVLDQTDLLGMLEEIDRDYCIDNGLPRRDRIFLAHILE